MICKLKIISTVYISAFFVFFFQENFPVFLFSNFWIFRLPTKYPKPGASNSDREYKFSPSSYKRLVLSNTFFKKNVEQIFSRRIS